MEIKIGMRFRLSKKTSKSKRLVMIYTVTKLIEDGIIAEEDDDRTVKHIFPQAALDFYIEKGMFLLEE